MDNPQSEMRETADEVLRITSQLILTGIEEYWEQEVEQYAAMMEKREPLIARMSQLKQKVDATGGLSAESRQSFDRVVKDIISLDKQQAGIIQRIKTSVQAELKGIKSGQKLNDAYSFHNGSEQLGFLDTKQ